jgi:hypothetical protein
MFKNSGSGQKLPSSGFLATFFDDNMTPFLLKSLNIHRLQLESELLFVHIYEYLYISCPMSAQTEVEPCGRTVCMSKTFII